MAMTRFMKEIYSLYNELDGLNIHFPEFVEDYLWKEEREDFIYVRRKRTFIIKGNERTVLCAILDTPLTYDAQLIYLDTDYWKNSSTTVELKPEAFFIRSYPAMSDAINQIIKILNTDNDLKLYAFESDNDSVFDTCDSLSDKIEYLLESNC